MRERVAPPRQRPLLCPRQALHPQLLGAEGWRVKEGGSRLLLQAEGREGASEAKVTAHKHTGSTGKGCPERTFCLAAQRRERRAQVAFVAAHACCFGNNRPAVERAAPRPAAGVEVKNIVSLS